MVVGACFRKHQSSFSSPPPDTKHFLTLELLFIGEDCMAQWSQCTMVNGASVQLMVEDLAILIG